MTTSASVNDQPDDAAPPVQRANVGTDATTCHACGGAGYFTFQASLGREMCGYCEGRGTVTTARREAIADPLPCDVRIPPSTTFGAGVSLALLLDAMKLPGRPRHFTPTAGPQADANAIPLRAPPCAPPEGNDAPATCINCGKPRCDGHDGDSWKRCAERYRAWAIQADQRASETLRQHGIDPSTLAMRAPPPPPEGQPGIHYTTGRLRTNAGRVQQEWIPFAGGPSDWREIEWPPAAPVEEARVVTEATLERAYRAFIKRHHDDEASIRTALRAALEAAGREEV